MSNYPAQASQEGIDRARRIANLMETVKDALARNDVEAAVQALSTPAAGLDMAYLTKFFKGRATWMEKEVAGSIEQNARSAQSARVDRWWRLKNTRAHQILHEHGLVELTFDLPAQRAAPTAPGFAVNRDRASVLAASGLTLHEMSFIKEQFGGIGTTCPVQGLLKRFKHYGFDVPLGDPVDVPLPRD